ncbi:MAG TPA: type II toxin-antitoxin system VapC family toxin [Propionibacteriaceae bacterium]|nr:type II toxin-antitoxin system VapC family toxin [Propionibacteriaceae bacterium]
MVIDTSALAAVVLGEPDAEAFLSVLLAHIGDLHISAATLVEAGVVVEARQGPEAATDLAMLLDRIGVVTVPFDDDQARSAVAGWRRFGKGRHPAGLNLGDCFAYALAKTTAGALLFKGGNLAQTDIASVL